MVSSIGSFKPLSVSAPDVMFDPTGTWTNELGSTMTISSFSGGQFSGTYTSSVSGGGSAAEGQLSGSLSGDAIAFVVNWDAANSVTAWSGLVGTANQGEQFMIYALWHLAETPGSPDQWWESILAGVDLFVMPT
jgi:hypothetical protein